MLQSRILRAVADLKGELIELTRKLVQIPTENKPPTGYEKEGQEYIAERYSELNAEIDLFLPTEVEGIESHPAYHKGRDYRDRPNVVARIGGSGGRSLILSGHMDTSPKEPLPWDRHGPFSGKVEDGKIYGRGGFDMKGGLAGAYTAAKAILESGVKLKGDLILESVVDEEYGGANGTLACRLRGYEADAAILMECSSLAISPATRGDKNMIITIKGVPGMPYTGYEPTNPVYGMARIIEALRTYEIVRNDRTERHPLYTDEPLPLPVLIKKLKAGEVEPDGALGLPMDCWLLVGPQFYPGATEETFDKEFLDFMKSAIEKDPILAKNPPKISSAEPYIRRIVEASEIDRNHPIVKEVESAFLKATGRKGIVRGAPFPCDAFIFTKYSRTPALVFGPAGANAHAPNEYVTIDSLVELTKTLALTIASWCG
ncbi:MAG: M20/M25/M40 family metallo-hydrolase [Nitrososphaeria archaeon]